MENTFHSGHYERLRLARAFIDRCYDKPITLEQISREAGFSPFHFIRLFRSTYRQTPHQYLIRQRVEKAKELLKTSDLSVTEICYAVGFESLGSFSTLFSKIAGISPSAYRVCSRPTPTPRYIPFCVSFLHGIDDQPNP